MARILLRKAFSEKYMAEVSATPGTLNFRSLAIGIRNAFHGAGDFIIETGPAAGRFELELGTV